MSARGGRSFGGSRRARALSLALVALLAAPTLLVVTAPSAEAQKSSDPWWGPASKGDPTSGWALRIPVTVVNNRTYTLDNQTVSVEIDFTEVLLEAGWTSQSVGADERLRGFTLDVDSIRVVEYGPGFSPGPVRGSSTEPIPHVFYPSLLSEPRTRDFDASRNPAGTVTFAIEGPWGPQERRFFYVYANPLEFGEMEPPTFSLSKSAPLEGLMWSTTGNVVYGFEPQQSNQNHRVHVIPMTFQPTTVTLYTYNVGRFQPVQGTSVYPNPVTLGFNGASGMMAPATFVVPSNTAYKIVADHPVRVAATGNGVPHPTNPTTIIGNETWGYVPSDANSFMGKTFTVYAARGVIQNNQVTQGSSSVYVIRATPGAVDVSVGSTRITLTSANPAQLVPLTPGWNRIFAQGGEILVSHGIPNQAATNVGFQSHPVPALTGGPRGTDFVTILPTDGGYARLCAEDTMTLRVIDQASGTRQLYPDGPFATTPAAKVEPSTGCETIRASASYPGRSPVRYLSTREPSDLVPGAPVPFRLTLGAEGRQEEKREREAIGPFAGVNGVDYEVDGPVGLFGVYPDTKVTVQEYRRRGEPLTYTISLPEDSFYNGIVPRAGDDSLERYRITGTKPFVAVSLASTDSKDTGSGHGYVAYFAGRPLDVAAQVGAAEFRGPLVEIRSAESDARQVFRSTGPATPATFPLEVLNLGRWIGGENLPDDIEITCADVPEEWKADGCSRTVRLDSRRAERVDVVLTPTESDVNKTRTITVTARSLSSGVTASIRLIVHVEIRYGIGMWFDVEGGRKSIDPPVGLDPAETHRYSIVVKNTGSAADRFEFEVEPPRDRWTQRLELRGEPVSAVTLEGGQSVTLHFVVTAPDAETAQQNIVRIKGQSVSSALAADVVNTATRIRPKIDVRLELDPPTRVARPNETATFNLTLTNSGNDIFRIRLRDDSALPLGWTSALEVTEVDLGPGQPFRFELNMTPPATARAGDLATAKIAAEIDTGDGGGAVAGDEVSAVLVVRKVHNLTTPSVPEATTGSGATLQYVLPVANFGNGDEVVEILPGASSPAWRLASTAGNLFLDLGQSADLPLAIEVPGNATPGDYNYTFTVRLSRETFQNLTIPVRVEPTPRLDFRGLENVTLLPGQARRLDATVVNVGNVEDDFRFASEVPASWNVTFAPESARLAPGQSVRVAVHVNASRDAADGAYAVTLTADGDAQGSAVVAATLGRPDLYVATVETEGGRPRAGDLVLVSATIGNRGDVAAENVQVALVVDGAAVDTVVLNRVGAGESSVATLSWLATGAPGSVEVRIDPGESLVETSREGNVALVEFGSRLGIPGPALFTLVSSLALLALVLRRRSA